MDTKTLACRLMGLTELEYESQLFDCGMRYLEVRFGDDPKVMQSLSYSAVFWKWWLVQWEVRTRTSLQHFDFTDALMNPSEIVRKRARVAYDTAHQIDKVASLIYSRTVIRDALREKRSTIHPSYKHVNPPLKQRKKPL